MGAGWRALRRRILTPDISATYVDKRGFHTKDSTAKDLLESIGKYFLEGYGYAAEAKVESEAVARLERLPDRFRGFAYEGAGMGFAVRDGLPFGGQLHTRRFLDGGGSKHVYTTYVGVGWAMARLPRLRWPDPARFDPLLRWLVHDGYGFHQAYFLTPRYVHGRYQAAEFGWIDRYRHDYELRAVDQGIGRALWFVGGADVDEVTRLIGRFDARRHGDLYSGAGLAATYAGGVDEDELRRFRDKAGEHRGLLAQGSAFAAEARVHGGVAGEETELATRVLCGLTAERAAELTHEARAGLSADGEVPAYEVWRQSIASECVVLGGNR